MGRTPSFTAQARGPDFYEWGKNGERDSASEWDEVERDVGFLVTKVMRALSCMRSRLMQLSARVASFGCGLSRWMYEIMGLFGYV